MILDEIAEYTKERVRALKAHKSLYAVRDEAEGRARISGQRLLPPA